MVSDFIQIFNNKSKYITLALIILVAVFVRNYMNHINSEEAGLIMYTSEAPSGASVKHNQFLLAAPIDIIIDRGDALATDKFTQNFSIIEKSSPISAPLNIRPTESSANFKEGTPLEVSFKLKDEVDPKNLHVLYHSQTGHKESAIGILGKNSIHLKNRTVSFKIKHFGNYQLVRISPELDSDHLRSSSKAVYDSKDGKHHVIYSNWK